MPDKTAAFDIRKIPERNGGGHMVQVKLWIAIISAAVATLGLFGSGIFAYANLTYSVDQNTRKVEAASANHDELRKFMYKIDNTLGRIDERLKALEQN